ncbi:hypothetical protein OSB04_021121 [Centaurea solstitialis]|uniref:Uncharacterized protein n=1 Tax=Centaurea solstitialis TaxID=347529 RepID=A0AA38STY6_9ASTR|nr:hypothetical protein OSB04_021121 [Centaurea solstitialis]
MAMRDLALVSMLTRRLSSSFQSVTGFTSSLAGIAGWSLAAGTAWTVCVGTCGPFSKKYGIWGSEPDRKSSILVFQRAKLSLLNLGGFPAELSHGIKERGSQDFSKRRRELESALIPLVGPKGMTFKIRIMISEECSDTEVDQRMSYEFEQPAITELCLQITSMLVLSSTNSSTSLMVLEYDLDVFRRFSLRWSGSVDVRTDSFSLKALVVKNNFSLSLPFGMRNFLLLTTTFPNGQDGSSFGDIDANMRHATFLDSMSRLLYSSTASGLASSSSIGRSSSSKYSLYSYRKAILKARIQSNCVECGKYNTDVSCAFIPEKIRHEAHPDHLIWRTREPPSEQSCHLAPKSCPNQEDNRLLQSEKSESGKRAYDLNNFFNHRKRKIEDELGKARKRNIEAKYSTWFDELNGFSEGQLRQFAIYRIGKQGLYCENPARYQEEKR